MMRPTWVTVVGVLVIIFGCFGLFGSGKMIILPQILAFEQKILHSVEDEMRRDSDAPEELVDAIMEMVDIPGWFKVWSIIIGAVGLLLNGLYVFGGIALLTVKRYAPRLVIAVLILSMILALAEAVAAGFASSLLGVIMMVGALFSIVIDFVLLLVIVFNDKSVFKAQPQTAPVQ